VILETAILNVFPGRELEFEKNFAIAKNILMKMGGYIDHELQKSSEQTNNYLLLVKWNSLEDHQDGFRKSEEYQEWKRLLHHFYNPFPTVKYYQLVDSNKG